MTLPFFTSPVKWLKKYITRNYRIRDHLRSCLDRKQVNNCTPSLYDWLYTQKKNNLPKKICSNAQDPEMLDLWDLGYLANHIRCNNSLKVFLFLIRFLAIKKSIVRCITSVAIIASIKSISSCFFSLVTFSFLVTSYKNMWICNSHFWRMCQILCTYWIEIVS